MSTEESWQLTPREFKAREKVHEAYLHRWAGLLAVVSNAPHFHKRDGKSYTADDYFDTPEARTRKAALAKAESRDQLDLMWMRQRMNRKLVESELPAWAQGPYRGNAEPLSSGWQQKWQPTPTSSEQ